MRPGKALASGETDESRGCFSSALSLCLHTSGSNIAGFEAAAARLGLRLAAGRAGEFTPEIARETCAALLDLAHESSKKIAQRSIRDGAVRRQADDRARRQNPAPFPLGLGPCSGIDLGPTPERAPAAVLCLRGRQPLDLACDADASGLTSERRRRRRRRYPNSSAYGLKTKPSDLAAIPSTFHHGAWASSSISSVTAGQTHRSRSSVRRK